MERGRVRVCSSTSTKDGDDSRAKHALSKVEVGRKLLTTKSTKVTKKKTSTELKTLCEFGILAGETSESE